MIRFGLELAKSWEELFVVQTLWRIGDDSNDGLVWS
jgi:hypothetical protein